MYQYRFYTGEDLLKLDENKQQPIVEDMLYENDYCMLIAKEKVGKSILALQLACCISSGTPFLGLFNIPKPQRVWYFATEGKDNDLKERLKNMTITIPMNKDNLALICSAGFRFNSSLGFKTVEQLLATYKDNLPKVIIIDALYMAIKGSLKEDQTVNDFTYCIRQFAETCDAAVLIVHHSRRPVLLDGVSLESNSDDDIYGSAFLKASVDHCFYMGDVQRTNKKFLKCDTQRSGQIIDKVEMVLIEPSPLYFEICEQYSEYKQIIIELLNKEELTTKQIMSKANLSKSTVYLVLKAISNIIDRIEGRPVKYKIKKI